MCLRISLVADEGHKELGIEIRDVARFQTKTMFINTTRKRQDTRSFNRIKDCLIGPLKLALDGEKL